MKNKGPTSLTPIACLEEAIVTFTDGDEIEGKTHIFSEWVMVEDEPKEYWHPIGFIRQIAGYRI